MKRRWYVVAASMTFLLGLVWQAPAATLYAWFSAKQANAGAALYGVQGSVGDGRASSLRVNAQPLLDDLHWHWTLWRLLLAQAAFRLDGGGEQASLEGRIAVLPTGGVNLDGLHARLPLKTLLVGAGQPYLPLDGRAALTLDTLKIRSHQLRAAEGTVQLQGLAWTLAASPVNLGDFKADITTDHDDIVAKIESVGPGPVEANGELKLTPDQNYNFHLQWRPRADASAMVRNLVGSTGTPDSQGWFHLRQQGRLP
ncbi:MAG: type II secretion system protein N [Nevskiaceae bacterium]|nr:MAG: type II secretion system protein N [Nevskiaceae bacterium]